MAANHAITMPVKNQAFRTTVAIRSVTTGNAITGGLTALAATASLDGAAFDATGLTVAEIGTTGFATLDIGATQMNVTSIVIKVSATNSGAMDALLEIRPEDLSEITGRADEATIKRPWQYLRQLWGRHFNPVLVNESTGAVTMQQSDEATTELTGTVTRNGAVETKSKFDL